MFHNKRLGNSLRQNVHNFVESSVEFVNTKKKYLLRPLSGVASRPSICRSSAKETDITIDFQFATRKIVIQGAYDFTDTNIKINWAYLRIYKKIGNETTNDKKS